MLQVFLKLFPSVTWRISTPDKILFLTFDDGPVPEATPEVLDLLSAYKAAATFFCIGENIQKHPEIFKRLISEGHVAGNHTYNHLNGWKTASGEYIQNVDRSEESLKSLAQPLKSRSLFRPPYGKMRLSQYSFLKRRYKIIMWDVLTRDWEQQRSPASCFERIQRKARPGSIIVFHDSIKARSRMLPALEQTLRHYSELGFRFESLKKYT